MKPGAYFEQTGDPAIEFNHTGGGLSNSGQDLQQRGLARSVSADDADYFALVNFEADIPERPNCAIGGAAIPVSQPPQRRPSQLDNGLAQRAVDGFARANAILLAEIFDFNNRLHRAR